MLRVASRGLSSLTSSSSSWRPNQVAPAILISNSINIDEEPAPTRWADSFSFAYAPQFLHPYRGFASESLTPKNESSIIPDTPTVAAIKNPTAKIIYDEYNHVRYPPGDPSKRAFAYFVLTGGRFVYASLIRLLVPKFVLCMSATKDVLALASIEVDLSGIEPGSTVTVKWRGKPVFIRHRTEEDIKLANNVDLASLRDPQEDSERDSEGAGPLQSGGTHLLFLGGELITR